MIRKTTDFPITGDGHASEWSKTSWLNISVQEHSVGPIYTTQVKLLYSEKGIYFLYQCSDSLLNATFEEDYKALFREDVIEVFLWPNEAVPVYFEYELSPLNYELGILVPNIDGKTRGWKPWHYEGERKTKHATSIQGGEKKSKALISGWTAEFFIPFSLLAPLADGTPQPGTKWRGNLYRIDYDHVYTTWTWQKTTYGKGGNFHEFKKYGTWIFE